MTVNGNDAEEAVLGAILNKGSCYKKAAVLIEEHYLYKEEHRLIWRAMTELHEGRHRIDSVSVKNTLNKHNALKRIGGVIAISSLMDVDADVANVEAYSEMVVRAYNSRFLRSVGRKLMNENISVEDRISIGYTKLREANSIISSGTSLRVGDVSNDIVSSRIDGNGFHGGIKMGFPSLDTPLNGLKPKDYVIVGARTSVGKSAFALQVALNAAHAGKSVLFFSPEMTSEQLVWRMLSLESGIPYSILTSDKELKGEEQDTLRDADVTVKMLNVTIDDRPSQNVTSVKLKSIEHQGDSRGLDLVIVDYIQQLCEGDDDKASVTIVSRGLKAIAKDLEIPVLACSQLRRRYGQEVRKPDKSMLRGSAQLENDADAVLLIWNPTKGDHSKKEVFIDKHRNGPLGQTMMSFDKNTTRFEEIEVW